MRRGGHKGVRKRFAAKTRTGCPNCRRRHIKCDEGRPTCQKCIRAGLTCEGYDSLPQPKIFQSQRDVQQQSTKSHAYFVWQSHHDADVKGAVVPKTLPTPAPQTPPALFSSPQATRAINFWLSKTRNVMVKSDVGAVFWSNLVPQAAWAFQPIQDSLNATVIVHESLDRGDDEGTFQRHKLEAAAQVNKAVRGLLESSPSPEEAMIMAAVLWTYGMVSGEYLESLLHLDHAARIARQTKKNRAGSQGIISFYLESLVNSFPKALNPRLMSILGPKLMLRHIREIQCNAVAIIRHLVMSLEQYEPLLINKGVQESYNVIATMQNIAEMAKWMMSLLLKMSKEDNSGSIECPEDGEPDIAQQSPFTFILNRLRRYLITGDETELRRFANDLAASWGIFQMIVSSNSVPVKRAVLEFYNIRPVGRSLTHRFVDMSINAVDDSTTSTSSPYSSNG